MAPGGAPVKNPMARRKGKEVETRKDCFLYERSQDLIENKGKAFLKMQKRTGFQVQSCPKMPPKIELFANSGRDLYLAGAESQGATRAANLAQARHAVKGTASRPTPMLFPRNGEMNFAIGKRRGSEKKMFFDGTNSVICCKQMTYILGMRKTSQQAARKNASKFSFRAERGISPRAFSRQCKIPRRLLPLRITGQGGLAPC